MICTVTFLLLKKFNIYEETLCQDLGEIALISVHLATASSQLAQLETVRICPTVSIYIWARNQIGLFPKKTQIPLFKPTVTCVSHHQVHLFLSLIHYTHTVRNRSYVFSVHLVLLSCKTHGPRGALSLYSTRAAGQEVLHVHRHSFGEVGHASKAATGGAVIQQPANSGGRVFLQDALLCSQVHLVEKDRRLRGHKQRNFSTSV